MSGAAHVVGLQNCVGEKILLQTQVVLVDVGRSQVWVDHEDCTATVDGKKLREADIGCRWFRRKWVYSSVRLIWLLEVTYRPALRRANAVEVETRLGIKRDLAVELQVIFAFQDVVENSEAAADAGLAFPCRIPGKAEAGREVLLVREVHTGWSSGITEKLRPWVSDLGVLYSYRRPIVSTMFLRTCHSSWPNT